MTVFKDSIHIGSISPSSTIHLGLSLLIEARSRMMVENKPAKKKNNYESATIIAFHAHVLPSPRNARRSPKNVCVGGCLHYSLFTNSGENTAFVKAVPAELRFTMHLDGSHAIKPCFVRLNRILWFIFDLLARC